MMLWIAKGIVTALALLIAFALGYYSPAAVTQQDSPASKVESLLANELLWWQRQAFLHMDRFAHLCREITTLIGTAHLAALTESSLRDLQRIEAARAHSPEWKKACEEASLMVAPRLR